jgi:hypothetical protein
MLPSFLLNECQVHDSGFSPPTDLGIVIDEPIEIVLGVTHAKERESLDLSVWGSEDGQEWGDRPLLAFPQKYYCGTYQMALHPGRKRVRFLQARWNVSRWGHIQKAPVFAFYVMARDLQARAMARTA